MNSTHQIHSTRALAAVPDQAYAPIAAEHTFEIRAGGDTSVDASDIHAETDPHPLTSMALAGAGNPVTGKRLTMTLSLLQQEYRSVITDDPSLVANDGQSAATALMCARHAAAHLTELFADLAVNACYDVIHEFFQTAGEYTDDPNVDAFWECLATLLYGYARQSSAPDWVPVEGVVPDDGTWSMPAWRTPDGGYVCDLITFMTPWDDDDDIAKVVETALAHARETFGARVRGIRLLPVFSPYLSRWYSPDLSWTPLAAPWC